MGGRAGLRLEPRPSRRPLTRAPTGFACPTPRLERIDGLGTGRDKPVPYEECVETHRWIRTGNAPMDSHGQHTDGFARATHRWIRTGNAPMDSHGQRTDGFARATHRWIRTGLVGAGLVPARPERVDGLDTGRDKPVPYEARLELTDGFATGRDPRRGPVLNSRWDGQARPLRNAFHGAASRWTIPGDDPKGIRVLG